MEQGTLMTVDVDKYLRRIGHQGAVAPDLATLMALHAAHVDAIPFESLDPYLRRPVPLDPPALQAKLVDSRRGGYCFEHNTLFKAVLEAIGFQVTGLGGRVRWMSPPDSPLGPREHMILKVDLPEGAFLADVGFGACLLDTPLRFETGDAQRTAMGTFRLTETEGLYTLEAMQPGGWRTAYVFNLEPQIPADYELGNWYTATSPQAPFLAFLIMERLTPAGRYKLINNRFIVEARDGQVVEERPIDSAADLARILDETFGVEPPAPVATVFERISAA